MNVFYFYFFNSFAHRLLQGQIIDMVSHMERTYVNVCVLIFKIGF